MHHVGLAQFLFRAQVLLRVLGVAERKGLRAIKSHLGGGVLGEGRVEAAFGQVKTSGIFVVLVRCTHAIAIALHEEIIRSNGI